MRSLKLHRYNGFACTTELLSQRNCLRDGIVFTSEANDLGPRINSGRVTAFSSQSQRQLRSLKRKLNYEDSELFNKIAFGKIALVLLLACSWIGTAKADIVSLVPTGNAGVGLLGGNVFDGSLNPGSGGVGPTGITLNTDTNILHIDIQWGSENGFTDMSGTVTKLHLHGMTADPAPDSFNQLNTNILINLGNSLNFDSSPTGGGVVDEFFVDTADMQGLMEGRAYINVHTDLNPMGELRGYLVAIPEPGGFVLLFWLAVYVTWRVRQTDADAKRTS